MDNGSSLNLLAYTTFHKMGFPDKDLMAMNDSFYGFTNNLVRIKGKIRLPVTLGEAPCTTTQLADILVIDENISYI